MNRGRGAFEYRARPICPRKANTTIGGPRKDVRSVAQETYRGGSVRTLPRPNKTFAKGRVCAAPGCGTKLSMYSKWDHCWQHEPVHTYIPRGKRKRRDEAA
jgi:hypothetical protein